MNIAYRPWLAHWRVHKSCTNSILFCTKLIAGDLSCREITGWFNAQQKADQRHDWHSKFGRASYTTDQLMTTIFSRWIQLNTDQFQLSSCPSREVVSPNCKLRSTQWPYVQALPATVMLGCQLYQNIKWLRARNNQFTPKQNSLWSSRSYFP